MSNSENQAKGLFAWIATSVIILAFLLLVNWTSKDFFPIDLWAFWKFDNALVQEAIIFSIPIFIWGAGITTIAGCFKEYQQSIIDKSHQILASGFIISLIAGVCEEIIFRWILFYSAMIACQISNFLFFGFIPYILGSSFACFEFTRIFYWYILAPVVNFFAFFKLDWILYEKGWIVGSAAVYSNAKFRDEHSYLGPLGYVNSWFLGFYLFWIMFTYGIPAAIVVHFVYDFLIFGIICLHATARKGRKNDEAFRY